MNLDDVIRLSALDQSSLLRTGQVSVDELTRFYLDRVGQWEPRLGAFVQQAPRSAIAVARGLDKSRARDPGAQRGALWGLPTAMKDIHLVRGMFIRLGSRAFRYAWSPIDDVSTRAVRQAGMVLLGKLATSELAILPFIDTDLHPPSRNPWDLDTYSGGSSGGCAAAVGAGLIPIAVASDGAGSIRIPAAHCRLVGHKPTRDLLPNPFERFEKLGMAVVGPHARSVDDAAALLDLLAGKTEANGANGSDGSIGSMLDAVKRVPERKLRIKVSLTNPVVEVEPHILAAVERVARTLEGMGHIVETPVEVQGTVEEFLPMFRFMTADMFVPRESLLQPTTRWLRAAGRNVKLEEAMALRERFSARIDGWFEGADICLTPTVAARPPRVGRWKDSSPEVLFGEAALYGAFTAVFNASGHPATTIPVWSEVSKGGESDATPPAGVQIVARRNQDALGLSVARALMEEYGTALLPLAPRLK